MGFKQLNPYIEYLILKYLYPTYVFLLYPYFYNSLIMYTSVEDLYQYFHLFYFDNVQLYNILIYIIKIKNYSIALFDYIPQFNKYISIGLLTHNIINLNMCTIPYDGHAIEKYIYNKTGCDCFTYNSESEVIINIYKLFILYINRNFDINLLLKKFNYDVGHCMPFELLIFWIHFEKNDIIDKYKIIHKTIYYIYRKSCKRFRNNQVDLLQ